jgi:hypothetical protein
MNLNKKGTDEMKKIFLILMLCGLFIPVFAGPPGRGGRGHGHGGPPRHDRKHEDLYVANGILDLVGKGLFILRGPQPVVVQQPVVVPQPVVTQPVITQPVVVQQPVVVNTTPANTTKIITVRGKKFLICYDANGKPTAIPIKE